MKWLKRKRSKAVDEDKPCKYPEADLECENIIIEEKARFGRVRNSLMKYLRAKYTEQVAQRALWRVNKRIELGIFTGEDRIEKEQKYLETAKRLRSISEIAEEEKTVMVVDGQKIKKDNML